MKISVFSTVLVLGVALSVNLQAAPTKTQTVKPKKPTAKAPRVVVKPSGLKIQDLRVGKGKVAKAGQNVTVNYRGTLSSGKMFDQSYGRGPFSFSLGAGQVIRGWDEGVAGMREGGKRRLVIPGKLGYGESGYPPDIPGNATLVFVVELIKAG